MTKAPSPMKSRSEKPVIVFSDLDGTLLDHDGYSFAPAKPALTALAEKGIALVPATSKTLAELDVLMGALGLAGAAIGENGAVIKFADGAIDRAVSRAEIARALADMPEALRHAMQCFCDMSVDEIAALTGLERAAAALAAKREASEPFLWHGDAAGLADLELALTAYGLQVTQGGRFFHIVPPRDKAAAMQIMLDTYKPRPEAWALGDGPNDVTMLLAADRAALIANHHIATEKLLPHGHGLHLTNREGALGWRDAMAVFLKRDFG